MLFVEGKGRHVLLLEMVSPLQANAAQQVLSFHVPQPPAARFRLTMPGDVEIRSGASVASRVVDESPRQTRFELLAKPGDTVLVMTLNSHLARRERAVVARSVLVDEVTQAYERLHATVSFDILHQATDRFRFALPQGFEITDVASPLVARWAIEKEKDRRVLDVRLREPTVETVVLNLSALKMHSPLEQWSSDNRQPITDNQQLTTDNRQLTWSFPQLQPLDVVGQVAVVGLLAEDRLNAEAIQATGLVPIDTEVLGRAMPVTVVRAEPAPTLRSYVAYYAPQAVFGLTAPLQRPKAEMAVQTNVLLSLGEQGQRVHGGFLLAPANEKLFAVDFSVPAGWHVTRVAGPDNKPLIPERYGAAGEAGRVHVRLPQGVPPEQEYRLYFEALSTPAGWLSGWESAKAVFPVFAVVGAAARYRGYCYRGPGRHDRAPGNARAVDSAR